jgi:hypothetical protein
MHQEAIPAAQQSQIKQRDPQYKQADISCIRAIIQASVNVELFTIPLYMSSMYSITGLHQINAKKSDFYTGRYWPGAASVPNAKTPNEKAFNLIFKVFIEEMLHLQLASNMATLIGVSPNFNSPLLQDAEYGWVCYNGTAIPHVLDFKDCTGESANIRVQLNAMNAEQVKLFLAIEETETKAKEILKPDTISTCEKPSKYFECAPYNWWKPEYDETKLPMFGSIGWMYTCFWDYLEIEYTDGVKLVDLLLPQPATNIVQQDQFNIESTPEQPNPGHPMKEYPGFNATMDVNQELKQQLMNAINAITDQGEGGGVVASIKVRWSIPTMPMRVSQQYQPNPEALKEDYKGYNDKGEQIPISGQAEARITSKDLDHYEVFEAVQQLIAEPGYITWDEWHKNPENKWTAKMLNPENTPSNYNIPPAEDVAGALNELKAVNANANHKLLSQAAVGTIKGITTQLNTHWKQQTSQFPSPAMYGSGDRVSICWAITGRCPDLSIGIGRGPGGLQNHACQGMDLTQAPPAEATCAAVEIYHSCKGSNECKTEGGCGFVQNSEGGGNCSQVVQQPEGKCGLQTMSAPANNKCGGFGGCAVPISASQLFPEVSSSGSYVMQLFNFGPAPNFTSEPLQQMAYAKGDPVYDIAWKAYTTVMAARFPGNPPPVQPKPSALRLAFPPST